MGDSGRIGCKHGTTASHSAKKANSTDLIDAWTEGDLEELNRDLRNEAAFASRGLDAAAMESGRLAALRRWRGHEIAEDTGKRTAPASRPVPCGSAADASDAPADGSGRQQPAPSANARGPEREEGPDTPVQDGEQGAGNRDGLMSRDLADDVREAFALAARALGAAAADRPAPDQDESARQDGREADNDKPAEDPGHRVGIGASPGPHGSAKADREPAAQDDQVFAALASKSQAPDPNRLETGSLGDVDGTVGACDASADPATSPRANGGSAPADLSGPTPASAAAELEADDTVTPVDTAAPHGDEAPAAGRAPEENADAPDGPLEVRGGRWPPRALDRQDAPSRAEEGRRIAAKVGPQAYGLSMTQSSGSKLRWLSRAAAIAVPLVVFVAGGFIGWSGFWSEVSDLPEVVRAGEAPSASDADAPESVRAREDSGAQNTPATFAEPKPAPAASARTSDTEDSPRDAVAAAAVGSAAEGAGDDLRDGGAAQAPEPAQTKGEMTAVAEGEPASAAPGDGGADDDAVAVTSRAPEPGNGLKPTAPIDPPGEPVETAALPRLHAADAAGTAGNPIPLTVSTRPADIKADTSFMIAGVPPGVSLSAGNDKGDGTWILRPEDLTGLTITPPSGYGGAFVLTVAMMKDYGPAKAATSEILEVTVAGPSPDIARLIDRGNGLLKLGDIASARLVFERAASHGSAEAATAVGKTYDPLFHIELGVRGPQADSEAAASWYKKGLAGADREAEARLARLAKWLEIRQRTPAQ